jgi:hypothetical protein
VGQQQQSVLNTASDTPGKVELTRKKTVREKLLDYEEYNQKSKNEEQGVLNTEDFDVNGQVIRKPVLEIDSDSQSKMKRVASLEKMKSVVESTEKQKHSIPAATAVEDTPVPQTLAAPDGGLTRSKSIKVSYYLMLY